MPIHDWPRGETGIYHHFHNAWIIHLTEALNLGVLPKGYSALSDQKVSLTEPDIITLGDESEIESDSGGGVAVAVAVTPRIQMKAEAKPARRLRRRRRVVIRRDNDDRVVAIVEVTSPGNKDSRWKARSLAEKVATYLEAGVHVLLVDILPPTNCDPLGIHGLIWEYWGRKRHTPGVDEPLTLVSYRVTESGPEAQIEPTAVGRMLPNMPLYLKSNLAVPAPLEATYMQAYRGLGERYRRAVESTPAETGQA
jgi:hypothetical protein